jgi:hypothetical protein
MIKDYVKTPEPVKAIRLGSSNLKEAAEWCGGEVRARSAPQSIDDAYDQVLVIPTLAGPVHGSIGTYLVRAVDGKFSFWPASVFEAQYTVVPDKLVPRSPITTPLINRSTD